MAIVKAEKRPIAIQLIAEIRAQLRGLLAQADALQANLEGLEIELGLSNEGEQSNRDQLLVLHYRQGDAVGHTLDECTDVCASQDVLNEVGEGGELRPELPKQDTNG